MGEEARGRLVTVPSRPIRAVVLGNSCALQVCTRSLESADRPYADRLRKHLGADGREAEVMNRSTWMGTVRDGVRDWPRTVWAQWPDLVVVHYGVNESRTRLIPPVIHRFAWTFDRADGRIEMRIAEHLQGMWPRLIRFAARYDREGIPAHMSARRFGEQLDRLVGQTVVHTNAVCVVVDLNPPNEHLLRTAGGAYPRRRERLQREIERVVASQPRTAVVHLADIVHELHDMKAAFPDGIHLSPRAHQVLAKRIAVAYAHIRQRSPDAERKGESAESPHGPSSGVEQ